MIRHTRAAAVIAVLLLIFAFSACNASPSGTGSGRLSIQATGFPEYDAARAIVGDAADLNMILPAGSTEIHEFEPSLRQRIAISESDLLIYCGGESDVWVDTLLASSDRKPETFKLMDAVELRMEESITGPHGTDDEYDEHVWTSPANMRTIVSALADRIIEMDPANGEFYRANADAYIARLDALDGEYRQAVESAARRTIVVGDRFPFLYLVREYGLDYAAAFPGCSSHTEENAGTTARLIDAVRQQGIPVVFYIEFSNQKTANAIAAETGAVTRELHSCHAVSVEDFEQDVTYIDIMERNLRNLREALN